MREIAAPFTIALIVVTSLVSIRGFRYPEFCQRHLFSVWDILVRKEWRRMITSAFLHADWPHLLLNMVSLYLFGSQIESHYGAAFLLGIYFAAVIGGSLLSLWMHRNHEYYAYGASGGVCGVIFSFIFLFPGSSISMFMLPFWIPGWLYAILYLAGSIYAMKSQLGNIGHDAHVGGAVIGMWTAAALEPAMVRANLTLFLAVSGIAGLLFLYLVKNPTFLSLKSFVPRTRSRPERKSASHRAESAEIDALLEKISEKGIHSLTPAEQARLNEVSSKYRRRAESEKPKSDLII
jgi:Uncharacterized membrane protein (homolog of Drosophila rhomboid)